jgi:hypothetical protein
MRSRWRRFASAALAALLLASACSNDPETAKQAAGEDGGAVGSTSSRATDEKGSTSGSTSTSGSVASRAAAKAASVPPVAIEPPGASRRTLGVTDKEIKVVYYWKGDRTRTSPYLQGTGLEAVVDEAQAFRAWIDYINGHADGGGDITGFPFDLHGRKLRGVVIEAGSSAEENVAAVTDIKAEKPFAAIAAHGSVSAYSCPLLAQAGILNLWTYDLDFDLAKRSKGWCLPGGASFDDQVSVMERYLPERVAKTKTATGAKRVFGVLYAEYPGLVSSGPAIAKGLKAKGLNVPVVRSISAELSEAQQQATTIATAFRAAGVNTMIIPDAGAPIAFTQGAQSIGWKPDYVVWPCSGQDAPAMVRLYSPTQWDGATGLTCYAQDFMIDLTHEDSSASTEWYGKYESTDRGEPPSQAPFVYAALLPLVAGVTGAGENLTTQRFLDALDRFKPYRYSAAKGRTSEANHMRLALDGRAHPLVDDFTVLRWSMRARSETAGSGAYLFPENGRRYDLGDPF